MSVMMRGELFNGTSVRLVHGPSNSEIHTSPPVDNGGDGSSFSPTDLCAASLGACAATIVALYARRQNIPLAAISFELTKEMQATPRKIAKITVHYTIKSPCAAADFAKLVAAGKTCPVRLTLGDGTEVIEEWRHAPP